MNNNIVILGTKFEGDSTIPKSLKVWESRFERNVGDAIMYEGERWIVQSVGFKTMGDAYDCMNGMSTLFVQKGYWDGKVGVANKF
jgi:hypothetical protein